jgi:hypothetical protein
MFDIRAGSESLLTGFKELENWEEAGQLMDRR